MTVCSGARSWIVSSPSEIILRMRHLPLHFRFRCKYTLPYLGHIIDIPLQSVVPSYVRRIAFPKTDILATGIQLQCLSYYNQSPSLALSFLGIFLYGITKFYNDQFTLRLIPAPTSSCYFHFLLLLRHCRTVSGNAPCFSQKPSLF